MQESVIGGVRAGLLKTSVTRSPVPLMIATISQVAGLSLSSLTLHSLNKCVITRMNLIDSVDTCVTTSFEKINERFTLLFIFNGTRFVQRRADSIP